MTRALAVFAFFLSIVSLPWFAATALGIFILSVWRERGFLILGGVLMDALFSVPVPSLGGFAYFYTALFALLILIEFFLRKSMID